MLKIVILLLVVIYSLHGHPSEDTYRGDYPFGDGLRRVRRSPGGLRRVRRSPGGLRRVRRNPVELCKDENGMIRTDPGSTWTRIDGTICTCQNCGFPFGAI